MSEWKKKKICRSKWPFEITNNESKLWVIEILYLFLVPYPLIVFVEKRPGVCDIELTRKPQVLRHQLSSWEQRNSVLLPEDFKNLYQMTDGMLLQWSVKLDGKFEKKITLPGKLTWNKTQSIYYLL